MNYLQNLWNALDLGSLRDTLLRVAAVLLCLILHETCHGIAAFFLGDPTAKRNHRLSLNPLRHIDWIGLAAMVLTGVGWASINVNSYPMVVEMGSGADVGKYTGMYYFFSMGAQVFTPIFSGVLLEHISYRTLFPYAAVFSLLSFITMLFVRHGDVKPQKKASVLENFDVDGG